MDWIAPANSLLYWGAVTAFAFAIATGVVRRWVLGRAGVRRGVVFVAAFIGVALVVGLLPSVVGRAMLSLTGNLATPAAAMWWSGALVLGVAGLGVLARAAVGDPSRGRRRCGKCWYDMSGTPGMVCPECGREAKSESRMLRTRRRKRGFAVAVVLLAGAGATAAVPVIEDSGWEEWVPDTALVVLLPRMTDDGSLLWEFQSRFGGYVERSDPGLERWRSGWRSRLMLKQCRAAIGVRERPDVVAAAMHALSNIGDASNGALEDLFALSQDTQEHRDLRIWARHSLALVPSVRERVTAMLIAGLDDTDPAIRRTSIVHLSMQSEAEGGPFDAPPRLLAIAAGDADLSVQNVALRMLGSFRRSDEAATLLQELARSPLDVVRRGALRSLPHHVQDTERLHAHLLELSRDATVDIRLHAVGAIAQYGPYTDEGLDEMIRIADLPADALDGYAGWIYKLLNEAPVSIERRLALFERALEHPVLREAALEALEELGDEARPLVPVLRRLRDIIEEEQIAERPFTESRSRAERRGAGGGTVHRLLWKLDREED